MVWMLYPRHVNNETSEKRLGFEGSILMNELMPILKESEVSCLSLSPMPPLSPSMGHWKEEGSQQM